MTRRLHLSGFQNSVLNYGSRSGTKIKNFECKTITLPERILKSTTVKDTG